VSVDDRIRRGLEHIPTADPSGAYERIVEKRARRRVARSAGRLALALVVVAGSAGAFVALARTFRPVDRRSPTAASANGLIAFVRVVDSSTDPDTGGHHLASGIFVVDPRDPAPKRIATVDGSAIALDWSPDGGRLALGISPASGGGVWVMDADGSNMHRVIQHGWMPSWAPDGKRLAYVGDDDEVHVADADGSDDVRLTDLGSTSGVDWSPDGSMLAFAGPGPENHRQGWDIYVINADGTGLTNLTNHPAVDLDPAWSPDGSTILFRSRRAMPLHGVPEDEYNERLYTIRPDGSDLTELTTETTLTQSPTWSPDGQRIAFDDGGAVFTANADGSHIREVTRGWQPAWQPVAPEASHAGEPTTEPSLTQEPVTVGRDIGLGSNVCYVQTLGRLDLLGNGADGTAWTAAPLTDDGRCARRIHNTYLVAVDYTGDGVADDSFRSLEWCADCRPYAATDLDGDGDEELIVLEQYASTPQFGFFDVVDRNGEPRLRPIIVAAPGNEDAGFPANEPLTVWTGGDEGFSGAVACQGYPEDPELVAAWKDGPVEGPGSDLRRGFIVRLRFSNGVATIVGSQSVTQHQGETAPYPFGSDGRACGVDWNPF
jgi:Tol biopolymer transport system component